MNTFVVGYIVVWASVALYVGSMARRQQRLTGQYEDLRRQFERADERDAGTRRAA